MKRIQVVLSRDKKGKVTREIHMDIKEETILGAQNLVIRNPRAGYTATFIFSNMKADVVLDSAPDEHLIGDIQILE